MIPVRDNPFDSVSELTAGDPFNLHTQNLSNHILINWNYTYDKPVVDSYLLYRINGSDLDILYAGTDTTFLDTTAEWDFTYSYYVTGMINNKETSPPEIDDLKEVVRRIYVGSSDDFLTIQSAIDNLHNGDIIIVRDGTYTEHINFKGKAITLKSENGPDNCILQSYPEGSEPVVIFSGGEDSTTILDGFKITKGNSSRDGAGMVIQEESSPMIINCFFTANETTNNGGAIMIEKNAHPVIRDCQFAENKAEGNGGAIFCDRDSRPIIEKCAFTNNITTAGNGGAIAADEASPIIISCTFDGNFAVIGSGGALSFNNLQHITVTQSDFTVIQYDFTVIQSDFRSNVAEKGGSIYLDQCNGIKFRQCQFTSNIGKQGGGFYIAQSGKSQPINIENCILWQQSAYTGGAIYNVRSNLQISHCTIIENKAEELGPQSKGGGIYIYEESNLEVINSIFWQNTSDYTPLNDHENNKSDIFDGGVSCAVIITYTHIIEDEGGSGTGNIISDDPLFTNLNNGNFTLQPTSPCKDTGDPNSDVDSDGSRSDMGAHGGPIGDWE